MTVHLSLRRFIENLYVARDFLNSSTSFMILSLFGCKDRPVKSGMGTAGRFSGLGGSVLQWEPLDGQASVRFLRATIAFFVRALQRNPKTSVHFGAGELARGARRARQIRRTALRI